MPILYVLSGPDIGRTYELEHGATLGRAIECEATLRGTSISRKHARLEQEGENWILYDLGSRNGLHLDGVRVDRVPMKEGGTFHVGDLELRFRQAAQGVHLTRRAEEPEAFEEPGIEFGDFEEPEQDESPDGILFEGEELFDQAPPVQAHSAPQPAREVRDPKPAEPSTRAKPNRKAERMAAAGIRTAPSTTKTSDGRPVLQFTKPKASTGFFSNDLGQYPLPVRLAAGAVAILVFVGLFYFAYRSANSLKSRAVGPQMDQEIEAAE